MPGFFYLITIFIVGFVFVVLMIPGAMKMMEKTFAGREIKAPSFLIIIPFSFVSGTMLMSWFTYIMACIFSRGNNPLKKANIITFMAAGIIIISVLIRRHELMKKSIRKIFCNTKLCDWLFVTVVLVVSTFLMFMTFFIRDNNICVGVSVFSDFSPHLGMIRSFSKGNNFPTHYSHFSSNDIKYHFMFQFLVGNLEYLGMRLDFAFNIPSILSFVSMCMLLYSLAIKLFGKRIIGLLSAVFLIFRSGSALPEYISGINGNIKVILQTLADNTKFIGETLHEDWGLFNINVYVNQRHLALGISMILIVLMVFLPRVFEASERIFPLGNRKNERKITPGEFLKKTIFEKEGWLPESIKIPVIMGIFIGMTAFFNGACVIACLLIMFFLAFVSDRRLEYLITAVISVSMSYIQTSFFMDGNGEGLSLRWDPGFLADVPTFFGSCEYLVKLLGLLPFIIIVMFLMVNGYYKWILFSFVTPLIFAMTIQMTVDTAVNHKYVMISCILAGIFAAALVYRLWNRKGIMTKLVSVLLLIILTCTGIYDFYITIKKNSHKYGGYISFAADSPITEWVDENSDYDDVFLTDKYTLNEVVLGGASLFYGWPYYAWSAGYDTYGREETVIEIFSQSDKEKLISLCNENNIRYIVIDRTLRTNKEFVVREDVISITFELVYTTGEGVNEFNIYDVKKIID